MKGKLFTGITLKLIPEQINESLLAMIADMVKKGGQRTADTSESVTGHLTVRLLEPRSRRWVSLTSKLPMELNRRLMEQLADMDLEYSVDTNKQL